MIKAEYDQEGSLAHGVDPSLVKQIGLLKHILVWVIYTWKFSDNPERLVEQSRKLVILHCELYHESKVGRHIVYTLEVATKVSTMATTIQFMVIMLMSLYSIRYQGL